MVLHSGSKDSSVHLWNTEIGRFLPTLRGHFWEIDAVAVSPDGKTVFSAGNKIEKSVPFFLHSKLQMI